MKNKLIISFLLASVLTPSVSHAFGNRDSWVSGYAQGTSEYTILGKGNHNFIWPAIVPAHSQRPLSSLM